MRTLDLFGPDRAFRLAGVVDEQRTPTGLRLSRLPARAQAQSLDPALPWAASQGSGTRLELVTDATRLELDVQLLRLSTDGRPAPPAPFDLVAQGELRETFLSDSGHQLRYGGRDFSTMELVRGAPGTVCFEAMPPSRKRVEVWLPHNASLELRGLRVDDGASSEAPEPLPRRWIHYGSSISHCLEAVRPTGVWPAVSARLAGVELTSLGLAGQAQLDQVVARAIRDLPADFVSLKVGINVVNGDTMRERTFAPAVHGFLDTIRDGHPDAPILVVTPIICPMVEDHPGPTVSDREGRFSVVDRPKGLAEGALSLSRIRALLDSIVDQRRGAGDRHLHILSGLDLFGPGDVSDLPDGLHPNPEGYLRIGRRFYDAAFGPGGPFPANTPGTPER